MATFEADVLEAQAAARAEQERQAAAAARAQQEREAREAAEADRRDIEAAERAAQQARDRQAEQERERQARESQERSQREEQEREQRLRQELADKRAADQREADRVAAERAEIDRRDNERREAEHARLAEETAAKAEADRIGREAAAKAEQKAKDDEAARVAAIIALNIASDKQIEERKTAEAAAKAKEIEERRALAASAKTAEERLAQIESRIKEIIAMRRDLAMSRPRNSSERYRELSTETNALAAERSTLQARVAEERQAAAVAEAARKAEADRKTREEQERQERDAAARRQREQAEQAEKQRQETLRQEEERKAAEARLEIERQQVAEREAERERQSKLESDRRAAEDARKKAAEDVRIEAEHQERVAAEEQERAERARVEREARLARERAENEARETAEQQARARAEQERRETEAREKAESERKAALEQDRLESERAAREAREAEQKQAEARAELERKQAREKEEAEVKAKADEASRRAAEEQAAKDRIADAEETARMEREARKPLATDDQARIAEEEKARQAAALKRTESGVKGVLEERAVAEADKGGVETVAEVEAEANRQRAQAEEIQQRAAAEVAAHEASVEDYNRRQATTFEPINTEAEALYGVWEGKNAQGETIRSTTPFGGATLIKKGLDREIDAGRDALKAKAERGEEVTDADIAPVNKLIDEFNRRSTALSERSAEAVKKFGAEAKLLNNRAEVIGQRNALRQLDVSTQAARLQANIDAVNFRSERAYAKAVDQAETRLAGEIAAAGVERHDAEAIAKQELETARIEAGRQQKETERLAVRTLGEGEAAIQGQRVMEVSRQGTPVEVAEPTLRAVKGLGEGEAEIQQQRVMAPSGVEVAELTPTGIALQSSGRTDLIADEASYRDSLTRYADDIRTYTKETGQIGRPIAVDADPRVLADLKRLAPDLNIMTPDEYKKLPPQVQVAQPTGKAGGSGILSDLAAPAPWSPLPLFGLLPAVFKLADHGNRVSQKLDIVPGEGAFKPFAELNNYGAHVIAENRAIADRLDAKGGAANETLAAVIRANATVVDFIRPRGAVDVALIAGPAAVGKLGNLGKAAESAVSVETVTVESAQEASQALKALARHESGGVGELVTKHVEIEAGAARSSLPELRQWLDNVPAVEHPKGFVPELIPTRTRAITQMDVVAAAERQDLAAARTVANELRARGMEPGTLTVTVREAMKPAEVKALAQDIKASGFKKVEIVQEPAVDAALTKWRVLSEAGADMPPLERFRKVADQPIETLWKQYEAKGSYVDPTKRTITPVEVKISGEKTIEKAEAAVTREPKPLPTIKVVGDSAFTQVKAAEKAEAAFDKSAKALERASSGKAGIGPKVEVTTSRSLRGDAPVETTKSEIRIRFAQKREGGLAVADEGFKLSPPELAGRKGVPELPSGKTGIGEGRVVEEFKPITGEGKSLSPRRTMTAVEEAEAQVAPRRTTTVRTQPESEALEQTKRVAVKAATDVAAVEIAGQKIEQLKKTEGGELVERKSVAPEKAKPVPRERVRGRPEPAGRQVVTEEPIRAIGRPLPVVNVSTGQPEMVPLPGQIPVMPGAIPGRPMRPGRTAPSTTPSTRPETPVFPETPRAPRPGRAEPQKAPERPGTPFEPLRETPVFPETPRTPERAPRRTLAPVEVPAPFQPTMPGPGKIPGRQPFTPTAPGPKTTPGTKTRTEPDTETGTGVEINTGTIAGTITGTGVGTDIVTGTGVGTETVTETAAKVTTETPTRVGVEMARTGRGRAREEETTRKLRRSGDYTEKPYKAPKGTPNPAKAAWPSGIFQRQKDLNTEKVEYGKGFLPKFDAHADPVKGFMITKFGVRRPKTLIVDDVGAFIARIRPDRNVIEFHRKVRLD